MTIKRILLLGLTLLISLSCVSIMNIHYDVLSRYTYEISLEDAEKLRNNLTYKEIDYIIDYSINSDSFIDFVDKEGFNIYHFPVYNRVKSLVDGYYTDANIVYFTEKALKLNISEDDLINYIGMGYPIETITSFYEENTSLLKRDVLAYDPLNYDYTFEGNETVFTLTPYDLVIVDYLPNSTICELRNTVNNSLRALLKRVNDETDFDVYTNADITKGYMSYEMVNIRRRQGDKTLTAGKNYYQLGRMFTLSCNERYSNAFFETFDTLCSEYGFTLTDALTHEYLYTGN